MQQYVIKDLKTCSCSAIFFRAEILRDKLPFSFSPPSISFFFFSLTKIKSSENELLLPPMHINNSQGSQWKLNIGFSPCVRGGEPAMHGLTGVCVFVQCEMVEKLTQKPPPHTQSIIFLHYRKQYCNSNSPQVFSVQCWQWLLSL